MRSLLPLRGIAMILDTKIKLDKRETKNSIHQGISNPHPAHSTKHPTPSNKFICHKPTTI